METKKDLTPAAQNDLELITTFETRPSTRTTNYELAKIAAPEYGVWLETGGKHIRFYWPTEISKRDVVHFIYTAAVAIRATSYGWAHIGMNWMWREDTTEEDTQNPQFHMSMMLKALRSCGKDLCFTELATSRSGQKASESIYVKWVQAFNDGDHSRNQCSISGDSSHLRLTDQWVGDLMRMTADETLKPHIDTVTTMFQERFEGEAACLAIGGEKLKFLDWVRF